MGRKEFSKATKAAAFERENGICQGCHTAITTGAEYDHALEDYVGGDNNLENCVVLCGRCHKRKTAKNRPAIDKTRRIAENRMGLRSKARGFSKPPPGFNVWTKTWDK
jgi:5-methylcytosine-specific restriction endonuclease McrA